MRTMKRNAMTLLFAATALCLLLVLPAVIAQPASAAVIAGTTGTGTEDDPIVVDTYEEFRQAMYSSLDCYIELVGNNTFTLPDIAEGYGKAAITQYPGTTKHLTVTGNIVFKAAPTSYPTVLSIPIGSTLKIDGSGMMKFLSSVKDTKLWDSSVMLRVMGDCYIGGNVTLLGEIADMPKDSTDTAAVRIVEASGIEGMLTVSGNPYLRGHFFQGDSLSFENTAAVTVRNGAQLTTTGGKFDMLLDVSTGVEGLDKNANINQVCGLYVYFDALMDDADWVDKSVDKYISLYGGEFHGISLFKYGRTSYDDDVYNDLWQMLGATEQDGLNGVVKVWDATAGKYCTPELLDYDSPHTSKKYTFKWGGTDKITVDSYDYHWITIIHPESALVFVNENPNADPNDAGNAKIDVHAGVPVSFSFSGQKLPAAYTELGYRITGNVTLYSHDMSEQIAVKVASQIDEDIPITLTHTFPHDTEKVQKYIVEYNLFLHEKTGTGSVQRLWKKESLTVNVLPSVELSMTYDCVDKPIVGDYGINPYEETRADSTVTGAWYRVDYGTPSANPMTAYQTYASGCTYRLCLTFKTKPGYFFAEDSILDIHFNGEEKPVKFTHKEFVDSNTMTAYYDITMPNVVTTVKANLPELYAGAYTGAVRPSNNAAYQKIATIWYEEDSNSPTGWKHLWQDDGIMPPRMLQEGKKYKICANFNLNKANYQFANDVSCYLSGEKATLVTPPRTTNEGYYADFAYIFTCKNKLQEIEISLDDLRSGMTPAECKAELNWSTNVLKDTVKMTEVKWYLETVGGGYLDEDDPLQGGYTYLAVIVLEPDGCELGEKIEAAFNEVPVDVIIRDGKVYCIVPLYIPMVLEDEDIRITLPTTTSKGVEYPALIVGEPLPVPVPPEGTEIVKYYWMIGIHNVDDNMAPVEAGKNYRCNVYLKCKEGNKFDLTGDSVSSAFSGNIEGGITIVSDDECRVLSAYLKTFVDYVSIVDVEEPIAGVPIPGGEEFWNSFGRPETAGVQITGGQWWPTDTVFVAGKDYTLAFVVSPMNGVSLTDDAVVMVNGKKADLAGLRANVSFTAAGGVGTTVSGKVTTYGDESYITIELFRDGSTTASNYTSVKGGNGTPVEYSIPGVMPGTYTMKVSKKNHVTREYTITVAN